MRFDLTNAVSVASLCGALTAFAVALFTAFFAERKFIPIIAAILMLACAFVAGGTFGGVG